MQLAGEAYRQGKHQEALAIYGELIEQGNIDALLNRASLLYGEAEYTGSLADARKYLEIEQPKVEGYVLLANSLIKSKKEVTEKDRQFLTKGKSAYPYHKKLQDSLIMLDDKVDDTEEYLERMFQKLLKVPTVREWMQQQSFLTKLEKMLENPSLASALIKIDPRLADVQELILMSDE